MKFITQDRQKFTIGWAIAFTAYATLATCGSLLTIWAPMPVRPLHPDLAAIFPEWVAWLKEHQAEYYRTWFTLVAILMAALAGQAWGDARK